MKTTLFSMRLSKETKQQLEMLSKATGRSMAFIVSEAIEKHCKNALWQISGISKAILEADNDEMVSQETLKQQWIYK